MRTKPEGAQSERWSRRQFLRDLCGGAAAVSAASAVGLSAVGRVAQAATPPFTLPGRFGRMFHLPPFAPSTDAVRAALLELGKPGGIMDARDNLGAGAGRPDRRPGAQRDQPQQPRPPGGHDVHRPVPGSRHDVRHQVPAGSADGAHRLAQCPDARLRPRLGLWRGAGRLPAAVRAERSDQVPRGERGAVRGPAAQPWPQRGDHRRPPQRREPDPCRPARGLPARPQQPGGRGPGAPAGSGGRRRLRRGPPTCHLALPVGDPPRDPAALHRAGAGGRPGGGRATLLPSPPGPGIHARGVPDRLSLRAQHGAPVVPGQPGRRQWAAVLRPDLRSRRGGQFRSGRPPGRGPGATPVRRLADVLRLRGRRGQAQQADRHEDLDARCSTFPWPPSRPAPHPPRSPSGICSDI